MILQDQYSEIAIISSQAPTPSTQFQALLQVWFLMRYRLATGRRIRNSHVFRLLLVLPYCWLLAAGTAGSSYERRETRRPCLVFWYWRKNEKSAKHGESLYTLCRSSTAHRWLEPSSAVSALAAPLRKHEQVWTWTVCDMLHKHCICDLLQYIILCARFCMINSHLDQKIKP